MQAQAQQLDYSNIIPHSLRPICRAYALGHLTTTAPRLFGFLRLIARRKDITVEEKLQLLKHIIRTSTQLNRFPTACAIIIGGATALPRLIRTILQWLLNTIKNTNGMNSTRLNPKVISRVRYICSFLSACLAFNLLNRDEEWSRKRLASLSIAQQLSSKTATLPSNTVNITFREPSDSVSLTPLTLPNQHHYPNTPPTYAGKTTDFTLFALTRALSTLISTFYTSTSSSTPHSRLTTLAANFITPLTFSLSTTIIMWSWFYSPERLPASYNNWISTAASIDPSLIQALRLARQGEFVYGHETGQSELLADLCHKIGEPASYGDPVQTIPVPCSLYHSGTGPSCEFHALTRWMRSWTFAMKLYLPLQILTRLRSIINLTSTLISSNSTRNSSALNNLSSLLFQLFKKASLSSSFLATFISLFYYSVCLARTRLGPNLFPSISPQALDSGLCVLAGCLSCGWSILLEHPSRRLEMALFAAPRALATLLPRIYERRERWKEQVVFAGSVAVVMGGLVDGRAEHVRGVLGKVLGRVVREY